MRNKNVLKALLNFLAITLLFGIVGAPFYFAKNFSQVAGVKTELPYIVTTQIDKFPNLKLNQSGNLYEITFTKNSTSQVFVAPLLLTNPTQGKKTYVLKKISGEALVFFGEDQKGAQTTINAPSSISIPISIYSGGGQLEQTVSFTLSSI